MNWEWDPDEDELSDDPFFFDGFLEDLHLLWIEEPPLSFRTTEEEAEEEEEEDTEVIW